MAQPKKKQSHGQLAQQAKKRLQFSMMSRLLKALAREFTLQSIFKLGYRNKEDVSNLPAYTLVVGSQNVLTNAAEQIVIRNGYQLDGSAGNQNTYGIDSGYDFDTHVNGIQNMRKWGGNLEVRYTNPVTSVISWVNILSTLVTTNVCNFTTYWDNSLLKQLCLFVNGNLNIYRWTGAVASYASSTATTITASGTKTLAQLNFDTGGLLLIDGVSYAYTSAGLISATPFSQAPTNTLVTLTTSQWLSQLFTTGAAATQIISVSAVINSNSGGTNPANFTGSIYTDSAGVPGTLVGAVRGALPGVYSSGNFTINFPFNLTVSGATNYHFVLALYNNGNSDTISGYTGVTGSVGTNISTDTGGTWSAHNGYLNCIVTENDSNTLTFNGVSPAPSGITVGDAIIQAASIATTAVTNATALPAFDLISTFRNQVYYGCFTNSNVYISKVNAYNDASYSTPRIVGEGASVTLDAPPVGFAPQEDAMYISAGKDYWYRSAFVLSSDNAKEAFQFNRLKTTSNQGAQSQALIGKLKNSVVYVSHEPIFNSLGPIKNVLAVPQVVNMSDPIKYDMDAYTYTGGSVHYNNYFVYFSVPTLGIVRLFNVQKKYWEAPQTIPVGMFYEVNGLLYGHSGTTNESYQLFVPSSYNDNNNPISAMAAFPYVSSAGGQANQKKMFNQHYTEGYIGGNTTLTLQINWDFGGFSGTYSVPIKGSNKSIIFNKITDGSLGQNPLGSQPIGAILNLPNQPVIPKFRIINTFTPTNHFEYQLVYSSNDIDQNWALLRFGPATHSADIPTEISQ